MADITFEDWVYLPHRYEDNFVENLSRELRLRRMNHNDLSRLSGLSPSFLSDMFRRRTSPSLRTMARLSASLRVPLGVLLERQALASDLRQSS